MVCVDCVDYVCFGVVLFLFVELVVLVVVGWVVGVFGIVVGVDLFVFFV